MSSLRFLSSCSKMRWLIAVFALTATLSHAADPGGIKVPDTAVADKPSGRMITLSDFGAEDLAYLAIPSTPPTLAVVLVPDAYGLDDFTKAQADWLAEQGYLVAAVDIYNGRKTTDAGDLANLVANLNAATIMKTIDAGVRFFHESPKFKVGHVVAMGWGVGARYVFQAARENKGLDGAITFYGPIETADHPVGKFNAALCGVYPTNDPVTPRDSVLAFLQAMKTAGNDCEGWFIAAGSGWSHPRSRTYNATEDREAWKVAVPFLVRVGAEPVKPEKESIIDKAKAKLDNFFQ
jgi:carboxymethylenebutenolidase